MPVERPTRRRAIAILAASTAGFAFMQKDSAQARIDYEWHGLSMGTDAYILFCGIDRHRARALTAMAVAEIERLERALSLFRDDSEICHLNRLQMLRSPTGDMRRALTLALSVAQASNGLFDPTVQALWEAHVDWFAAEPAAGLPPRSVLAPALAAVDWRRVSMSPDAIQLGPGQRITLNGLGQGYVTDRVADLLRRHGVFHILVDLGEQRALGSRSDGSSWLIACEGTDPITLLHGALATSEGAGCVLGAGGAAHHLFDPRTGRSAAHWRKVTVHHASAAIADALSTTLYVASPEEVARLLDRIPGAAALAIDRDGRVWRWNPWKLATATI